MQQANGGVTAQMKLSKNLQNKLKINLSTTPMHNQINYPPAGAVQQQYPQTTKNAMVIAEGPVNNAAAGIQMRFVSQGEKGGEISTNQAS